MFDLANWKNPETLMLNITNSALGIATIVLIVWICGSAIHEFVLHHRESHTKH
jgi:beta-lactamase regulating signal transducer with metallopeptidase domain